MNFWKVILATIVIFGAGVFTGGLLVNHVDRSQRVTPRPPPALPVPHGYERGNQFIKQLNDRLQLTADQKDKIQKIVAAGQEQNTYIWTNVEPKMVAVIQDVNQKIRAQLTPEQQKDFDELLKHPPHRPNSTNAPSATNMPGKATDK